MPPTAPEAPAIPITLGVVGHRHWPADAEPALRAGLGRVFAAFEAAYPSSPFVLLSALAEGADQLAADVALERGWSVRAPLPFPESVYRDSTSFTAPGGRATFDRLLADPRVSRFVTPLPAGVGPPGGDWAAVARGTEPAVRDFRHQCYANAGGYIVRHCHALVALWDGRPGDPGRPSGTAEVVAFKLSGTPPARYPWAGAEPLGFRGDRGPVIVLDTPRPGPGGSAEAAGRRSILVPAGPADLFGLALPDDVVARRMSAAARAARRLGHHFTGDAGDDPTRRAAGEARQLWETCQAVDDFNRDVRAVAADPAFREVLRQVDQEAAGLGFTPEAGRWFAGFARARAAAGHLAGRLDGRLRAAETAVFVLLALAAIAFHLYAHPLTEAGGHPAGWLVAFLALLAAAVGLIGLVWVTRLDERRLDYRALAEALRVRAAWAAAGVARSVADAYPGQVRTDLAWARRALQHTCPPVEVWAEEFARLDPARQRDRLAGVRAGWAAAQRDHFRRRAHAAHTSARWLRLAGFAAAVAGWALVGSAVLIPGPGPGAGPLAEHPPPWLLLLSGLLVIAGGLGIVFSQHRAHLELANQYERMGVVFDAGLIELDRWLARGDVERAQAVIAALGREALAENAQWLLLRRSRPLELHFG